MNDAIEDGMGDGEPTHSPDGIDLTLIRWMLSLTPAERLHVLQGQIDAIRRLKGEDGSDPA